MKLMLPCRLSVKRLGKCCMLSGMLRLQASDDESSDEEEDAKPAKKRVPAGEGGPLFSLLVCIVDLLDVNHQLYSIQGQGGIRDKEFWCF